ncbi:exonuclease [Gordonia phage Verity]|uniref:Exonuclease n=1 Tax=Gordonia phage Verity TaxID=2591211 RepID=A0A514DIU3_9CAUD|nr:RecE-like recombination exonuclease [Gordonia phage Verity]QDH93536.1 exonuclease [Gordonia phage Verity]QPO16893.1 exonuclease [Gordonia phage Delrey21]QXN74176.1 exonuclease [Gordonia phage DoctorFroggo]
MTGIINPFPDHTVMLEQHDVTTLDGRIAWLEQRREGIGSSDCSSVLGMNKWDDATPWHVFMDKTGQIPLDDGLDSEQMEIGREVEGAIVRMVARRLGVDYTTGLPALASKARPWQRSNLDAVFATDDGPIPFEAKNTSEYQLEDWVDQVPDHAELQILHTLAVTGAPYGYVGGMVGGRMIVYKRIDRDNEFLEHITHVEAGMWARVQAALGVLADPDIDAETCRAELRKLEPALTHRDTVGSILRASGRPDADTLVVDAAVAAEARAWMVAKDQAAQAEKDAKAAKDEARNNLVRIADGHDVIAESTIETDEFGAARAVDKVITRIGPGTFAKTKFIADHPDIADVTMKKVEQLDVDALKREHPDLYDQYRARVVRGPRKNDPQ